MLGRETKAGFEEFGLRILMELPETCLRAKRCPGWMLRVAEGVREAMSGSHEWNPVLGGGQIFNEQLLSRTYGYSPTWPQ